MACKASQSYNENNGNGPPNMPESRTGNREFIWSGHKLCCYQLSHLANCSLLVNDLQCQKAVIAYSPTFVFEYKICISYLLI